MNNYNDYNFGNKLWSDFNPSDLLKGTRKLNRIIGLTFPEHDVNLGLEPSILTVLPQGKKCELSLKNSLFNDDSVQYYLCSVYISGVDEFKKWAEQHDRNKIIVGGYHPTLFPEQFTRYAYKIVQGPCDDFWATIQQEGQIVKGVNSHNNIPRYDLYDVNKNQQIIPDKLPNDICTSINTSMGCNMRCAFCCSPLMCDRIMSKPLCIIKEEVDYLKTLNSSYLFIRDENFPLQSDWEKRLELIATTGAKIYLFASANTLTEDMVKIFKNNNVYMVCLGLENINENYTKNNKLDNACSLLKKYEIYIYLSFIVNPLEIVGREKGEDFYNRLNERLYELKPEMICGNFLMPFPGTKIWDKYYHLVSKDDFKYYNSKSAFLIKNEIVREKMEFFMYYFQHQYYRSEFYNNEVRKFDIGDTLHLRFNELQEDFESRYDSIYNVRP